MNQQKGRLVDHWAEARIGDYADLEHLIAFGGKMYEHEGTSYIDMPIASFKLESPLDPGYRRIE